MNESVWHGSFLIWIFQVLLCSIFVLWIFVLKRSTFSVLWVVVVCFLGTGVGICAQIQGFEVT